MLRVRQQPRGASLGVTIRTARADLPADDLPPGDYVIPKGPKPGGPSLPGPYDADCSPGCSHEDILCYDWERYGGDAGGGNCTCCAPAKGCFPTASGQTCPEGTTTEIHGEATCCIEPQKPVLAGIGKIGLIGGVAALGIYLLSKALKKRSAASVPSGRGSTRRGITTSS